jgi:hypothetical protein
MPKSLLAQSSHAHLESGSENDEWLYPHSFTIILAYRFRDF